MSKLEEIKTYINELKNHFSSNLNNKYVKNICLKLDLPSDIRHNMNYLIDYKDIYFDSFGGLEDIYSSILAQAKFVEEIKLKIIPNLSSYTDTSFMSSAAANDPKEKILYQMAIKNYSMNIVILAKILFKIIQSVKAYDEANFPKSPAFKKFPTLAQIEQYLQSFK